MKFTIIIFFTVLPLIGMAQQYENTQTINNDYTLDHQMLSTSPFAFIVPDGFIPNDDFSGFIDESTGATLTFTAFGPGGVDAAIDDQENTDPPAGKTLLNQNRYVINGLNASEFIYLLLGQGTLNQKENIITHLLILGDEERFARLQVSYPEASSDTYKTALIQALFSVSILDSPVIFR